MTTNTAETLSSTAELPPLKHPWNKCITVGRGYELLRADLREHLLLLQKEFGHQHICATSSGAAPSSAEQATLNVQLML